MEIICNLHVPIADVYLTLIKTNTKTISTMEYIVTARVVKN